MYIFQYTIISTYKDFIEKQITMKNGKFFTQFPNPVFLVLGTLCTGLRNEDKEDNRDKDDRKDQEN